MSPADLDDQSRNGGMKVKMLVGVAMIKREPGNAERLELRNNLGCQLTSRVAIAHENASKSD